MVMRHTIAIFSLLLIAVPALPQDRAVRPDAPPDSPTANDPPLTPEEALGLPPKDLVAGCLVLHDGRTYVGRITSVAGGYKAELPRGRLIFPYDQVRLTAVDLEEAYEKQREGLQNGSASERQDLARWCFENKLHAHARTECLTAIRMEPQRSDLRQLLLKIDTAMNQVNAATSPAVVPPSSPADDRRTAQGLTPKTNADFIRRVQPLLMNSCGNAACHGSASNQDFRLQPVFAGRGSQRSQSQYNLAQVLRQIDANQPESSPLLAIPRDRKGSPIHAGVYAGTKGYEQYELLKAWVQQAVQESPTGVNSPSVPEAKRPLTPVATKPLLLEPRTPSIQVTAGDSSDPGVVGSQDRPHRNRADSLPAAIEGVSATVSDEELLKGVRRAALRDPFDPEEFNQAVRPSRPQ